jgi:hypothetical protein
MKNIFYRNLISQNFPYPEENGTYKEIRKVFSKEEKKLLRKTYHIKSNPKRKAYF